MNSQQLTKDKFDSWIVPNIRYAALLEKSNLRDKFICILEKCTIKSDTSYPAMATILRRLAADGQKEDMQFIRSNISPTYFATLINEAGGKSGKTALHFAAEKNQTDMVLFLLELGADPLLEDGNKQKASELTTDAGIKKIFDAIPIVPNKEQFEIIKKLIATIIEKEDNSYASNLNNINKKYIYTDEQIIELNILIAKKCDDFFNLVADGKKATQLKEMLNKKTTSSILEHGVSVNKSNKSAIVEHGVNGVGNKKIKLIAWATYYKRTDIVDLLIESGATLTNATFSNGIPLLSLALIYCHDIAHHLLDLADKQLVCRLVNEVDQQGRSAFYYASKKKYFTGEIVQTKMMKRLSSYIIDPNHFDVLLDIIYSVQHQNNAVSIIKNLLDKNLQINNISRDGITPMSCACETGDEKIVNLLIDKGANVNTTRNGLSPLAMAVSNGHTSIASLLMRKNPRPEDFIVGSIHIIYICFTLECLESNRLEMIKILCPDKASYLSILAIPPAESSDKKALPVAALEETALFYTNNTEIFKYLFDTKMEDKFEFEEIIEKEANEEICTITVFKSDDNTLNEERLTILQGDDLIAQNSKNEIDNLNTDNLPVTVNQSTNSNVFFPKIKIKKQNEPIKKKETRPVIKTITYRNAYDTWFDGLISMKYVVRIENGNNCFLFIPKEILRPRKKDEETLFLNLCNKRPKFTPPTGAQGIKQLENKMSFDLQLNLDQSIYQVKITHEIKNPGRPERIYCIKVPCDLIKPSNCDLYPTAPISKVKSTLYMGVEFSMVGLHGAKLPNGQITMSKKDILNEFEEMKEQSVVPLSSFSNNRN